jgi:hypothetical protein
MSISYEELLAEMEWIDVGSSDGVTVTEIAEHTGKTRPAIIKQLKALAKEKRLVVGRKRVPMIDGRTTTVPCYRVASQKKGSK